MAISVLVQPLAAATLILMAVCAFLKGHLGRERGPPLPPGPPGEPFIGHLRVVPRENTAKTFAEWADEYDSDVIHVKTLGQSVIVLNSLQAARDLLDKRGANYCDRPRFTLLEVMGWGRTLTFMRYGKLWQMHRRLLQTTLSNTSVRQWQGFQAREARRSVYSIIRRPESWERSLRRFAVAIVLKVSYGIEVTDDSDPYVQIANDAMYATGNGGAPGNSVVDAIPLARYLPDWLVRDRALHFARKWRWAIEKLHDVPFSVAEREASNRHNDSLAHSLLKKYRAEQSLGLEQKWSLDDIKGAAGAVFIAGADTTWATLMVFVLNMVTHPEVQNKAQKLLDTVVGHDRLPGLADRGKLRYLDLIVQELYRWSPLAPLGIPHKSIKDDMYNGKLIPRGMVCAQPLSSIVYANVQAMGRDPRVYRDPERFYPERYESVEDGGLNEPLPSGHFGFGRRICVGRFLADNSVWLMVATMLATLSFQKATDSGGNMIEPTVAFTNGGTWFEVIPAISGAVSGPGRLGQVTRFVRGCN
ncbi:O-methylsterigmatocystin oxidoreductase-like protein [Hapsidospora chrysogenum ATCC 11550]|uniref:O-methylsterigmatocystin oxidoreductase-like protein n=1 Tax=Hapsidospora chrysogenum (strain ATCC 11550 / CBS 779.69 / DSM 880 / IAM 14645 / JCM 23072 / IMI 49137) TaxID=857340 RepID=A0A086TEE2_HAPC1|nr:O-methylsterigmatocystin oxidoreductase-like protein [Hapsidospora chrysogenum ATCC 11550]